MIYPDFLKEGDVVCVTAPSDGNTEEIDIIRLERAKNALESRGIKVLETPDVRKSVNGRSDAAKVRAKEFEEAWMSEAKAVFSAKGGDFLMEMLSCTDFDELAKNPKWFQGYSDNTSISFILTTKYDIASIYCNNFNDFAMECWHESIQNNWSVLTGNVVKQNSFDRYQNEFFKGETGKEGYKFTDDVMWNNVNNTYKEPFEGRLIGGCLDVLLNVVGTKFDAAKDFTLRYKEDGIIWYLETFSLGSEDIERGLWQLGEAGWFENVKGFVFGRPTFFTSFSDTSFDEAVYNALSKYNVPIITGADIGHRPPQFTMVNGAYASVSYKDNKGFLDMKFI